MKHHAQGDSRLDCVIGVLALTARFPRSWPGRIPVFELAIIHCDPDGQAAAIAQALLVLWPVSDAIGLLYVLGLASLEMAHSLNVDEQIRIRAPRVCHEIERRKPGDRNCKRDEGRPFGVGWQEQAPNYLTLLRPKGVVVSG